MILRRGIGFSCRAEDSGDPYKNAYIFQVERFLRGARDLQGKENTRSKFAGQVVS